MDTKLSPEVYNMIKEELIRELESLPPEERNKPLIATMAGYLTANEVLEHLKKDTEIGKKLILGEAKRRFRLRYEEV